MSAPVSVLSDSTIPTVLVVAQGPPSPTVDYLIIFEGDAGDSVTVSFLAEDDNGDLVPYTPAAADYRIDCLTTQQQVRDWTALDPVGETATITLTAEDTALLGSSGANEQRQIVVSADRGTAAQKSGYLAFWVRRLATYA
jgi:hypothetical protein